MFINFKAGDKVLYKGVKRYIMANGQEAVVGEAFEILRDVTVPEEFFELFLPAEEIVEKEQKAPKKLEEMNREELLEFAEKNNLDVDKRKGDTKLLAEIKALLNK